MSEHITDCECSGGGFCIRHKCQKSGHAMRLCRTSDAWFQAGENGTLLEQKAHSDAEDGERRATSGPGTELTAILRGLGIRPGGCACKSMAAQMNAKGPKWCRANMGEIASQMYQQAKKRKMPLAALSPPAIRLLIRWAIRRAEAKACD